VTFRSELFAPTAGESEGPGGDEEEYINPGVFGRALALFLKETLSLRGYRFADPFAEDWGVILEIEHAGNWPFWIGCANLDETTHRVFIQPDRPMLRRWFRKIDVSGPATRLAEDLDAVLRSEDGIREVRWDGD
jgi:hypothetical protein